MSTMDTSSDKRHDERSPSPTRVTLGRLAGAVGAVLLVTAPFTRWLTGEFGVEFWGKVAAGVLLVALYVGTNRDFVSELTRSRSAGLSAMLWVGVAIVLGLLGAVNYTVLKHDKSFDLTREGIYTLAPQTTQLLDKLDTDVQILAFYKPAEQEFAWTKDTLERYASHSKRLTYRMVDPLAEEQLAEKYAIHQGERIVVTAGGHETKIKDLSEQALTNAIIKVSQQSTKTVYFLTGHGGHDIHDEQGETGYGKVAAAIRAEGYDVKPLSLVDAGASQAGAKVDLAGAAASAANVKADESAAPVHDANAKPGEGAAAAHDANTEAGHSTGAEDPKLEVPSQVSLLVIGGLKSKLFPPEVQAIDDYLRRGGRLLVMLEPKVDTDLEPLLGRYSVQVHDDIVVDTNPLNRAAGLGPASPLVQPTEDAHEITSDLTGPAVMFTVRSLAVAKGSEQDVEAHPLMAAGDSAWGETKLGEGGVAERDDADYGAPDVAVVATKKVSESDGKRTSDEMRLVVFGDSDWVDNQAWTQSQVLGAANTDLFLNSVNWMAGQEDKITIRPKSRQASQLFLTGAQAGTLRFFSLDLLPVLLVALGVGIVRVRRQK